MKRPILLISAAVAVFAAGYFTGHGTLNGGSMASEKQGKAGSHAGDGRSAAGETEVRTKAGDRSGRVAGSSKAKGPPFEPGKSREWLEKMGRQSWDGDMVAAIGLVQQCSTLDPEAACEMAATALEMMKQLKEEDPAMEGIFKDPEMLGIAVISSIFKISQNDPKRAMELLGEPQPDEDSEIREMRQLIYANMAKVDLKQAMADLDTLQGRERAAALDGVVRALGMQDPQAAIDLLRKNPGKEYQDQRVMLVTQLVTTRPELALEAATSFIVDGEDPKLLARLVENGSPQLIGETLAWAKNYAGADREQMNARLLEAVAGKDPVTAAAYFNDLGKDLGGKDIDDISSAAVNLLFNRNQAEAAKWVQNLPPGPLQESSRLTLAQSLMEKEEVAAAVDVYNTMEAGTKRTNAALLLAEGISKVQPESALQMLDGMPEGEEKTTAVSKVFSQWMLLDPDAAAAKWQERP